MDNADHDSNPPARVVVRVDRDYGHARLTVQDFGVGLSPDEGAKVFDRFFRRRPGPLRSSDGAGLGLSLVQWVATAHGGTVACRAPSAKARPLP